MNFFGLQIAMERRLNRASRSAGQDCKTESTRARGGSHMKWINQIEAVIDAPSHKKGFLGRRLATARQACQQMAHVNHNQTVKSETTEKKKFIRTYSL